MAVTLTATWNPRGEMPRLQNLFPQLAEVYESIVISLPPVAIADQQVVRNFEASGLLSQLGVHAVHAPEWSWGRFVALQHALETPAGHIQYADLDRLLRWVEVRPEEWRQTVGEIQKVDCLIIGRTEAAYQTHPQALVQTEAISNLVTSYFLGNGVDISAGSKGFSRRAAAFLIAHTRPGRALGTDAEWPILLKRAGFSVHALEVDGLDWESADQYQERAASSRDQRRAAEAYDADPRNWERRVAVAMEIVQSSIEAAEREIDTSSGL